MGTLLLALTTSGVALAFALRSEQSYKDVVTANLEQADAIHELDFALLRQSGLTAWRLLDDSPEWRHQLASARADFERCLDRLNRIGLEPDQHALLQPIREAFDAYVRQRDRAFALHESGQTAEARQLLAGEAGAGYDAVSRLCKGLGVANDHDIERAIAARHTEARHVAIRLGVFLGFLALAGAALSWLFLGGVVAPLRRLTEDAREYLDQASAAGAVNEIQVVGACVEQLKSSVAKAHQSLAQSQERLMDAEKLATIGKLAAGVAHEIRSPLTSLKLRLYSMQKMLAESPRCQSDVRFMTDEINRLDSIIRNFLEFSRPPELRVQPCDASFLIDKTLELLRYKLEAAGIGLVRDAMPELPALLVDPHQMRQVLLNLLNNAIDAQPSGGSIRIEIRCERESAGERAVLIRIRDTGPGIPGDIAGRIFDPFFSTKPDGAGLGLWIAHRIVTQHGGVLRLEESSAKGTVFAIWIPVATEGTGIREQGTGLPGAYSQLPAL